MPTDRDAGRSPREQRRGEYQIAALLVLASAATVGFGTVYWLGGQTQLEGALAALAMGSLGVAAVVWARRIFPAGVTVERRRPLLGSEEDRDVVAAQLTRPGGHGGRRRVLRRLLVGTVVLMGTAAMFPLRSLGPRPPDPVRGTPWVRGRRLVDGTGRLIRAGDMPPGSIATVFPEGFVGSATGVALLIRMDPARLRPAPGREGWAPEGFIAYSKLCTHAACPVGLYEADRQQLLCPCHQSVFDASDAGRRLAGPAARPLPQLPLEIASGGELVATGEFSDLVGAEWWTA